MPNAHETYTVFNSLYVFITQTAHFFNNNVIGIINLFRFGYDLPLLSLPP